MPVGRRGGALAWVLLCAAGMLPADIIHLKNGNRISASSVREEGNRVSYETEDGRYSLPRSLVLRVEKEDSAAPAPARARDSGVSVPALAAPDGSGKAPLRSNGALDRDALNQLLDQRPTGEPARRNLAEIVLASMRYELQRGRVDSALSLLRQGLSALPDNPELALNYGVLLINRQQYQTARQWLTIASQHAPDSPEVWKFLGYAEYLSDRTPEAIRDWRKSLDLKADPEVQSMLGRALRETAAESNHEQASSSHFTLRFEGKQVTPELRRGLLEEMERHYTDLEQQLGVSLRDPIPVILYTEQAFRDVTRVPSWAGAVNDGRVRVPVDGLASVTPELSRVLKHELVHSFVWAKTRGRCPAWLNEGLAQLLEGSSAKNDPRLAEMWQAGRAIPIQNLHNSFVQLGTGLAVVAYAESLAAVEFLVTRYGLFEVVRMLGALGNGATMEDALSSIYRLTYDDLTNQVGTWLRS